MSTRQPGGSWPGWVVAAVCLLAAGWLAHIFAPGLMSFDSADQYDQAVHGEYNDQHSVLLALSVAASRALGGDLQQVIYLQCAVVILGVGLLAYESARFWLSSGRAAAVAIATLLLLLSRWSPLAVYSVTFWKDVWLMACLCWIGILAVRLLRTSGEPLGAAFWWQTVACALLCTLALLLRHNAVVLAPLFGLLLVVLLRPHWKRRYLVLALLFPAAAAWGLNSTLRHVFSVQRASQERCPLALDLLSLCAGCPEAADTLPYTRQLLQPDYRQRFVPGSWDLSTTMARGDYLFNLEGLKGDYRVALQKYPWQLLRAKLRNFWAMFCENSCEHFADGIHSAVMRGRTQPLRADPAHAATRERIVRQAHTLFASPRHWLFAQHGVWVGINIVLVVALASGWWLGRRATWGPLTLLASIPLVYCFSFLIASTTLDFRYFYAATLEIQTVMVAVVFAGILLAGDAVRQRFAQTSAGNTAD